MDYTRIKNGNPTYAVAQHEYDVGLRSYMISVYRHMAIALSITALVAMAVASSPALMSAIYGSPLYLVAILAPIAMVIYMSSRFTKMSISAARNSLWVYASLVGLSIASLFFVYSGASIARVFFISAGLFGSMSLYGYTTQKDLTAVGSFFIMGVWGIVLASVFNIFFRSDAISFITSAVAVIAFTGLTAYDTQRLRSLYYNVAGSGAEEKLAVYGALQLYLDFLNIFLSLLRFMGDRR